MAGFLVDICAAAFGAASNLAMKAASCREQTRGGYIEIFSFLFPVRKKIFFDAISLIT
jgi:hypothetical protein